MTGLPITAAQCVLTSCPPVAMIAIQSRRYAELSHFITAPRARAHAHYYFRLTSVLPGASFYIILQNLFVHIDNITEKVY